MTAEVKAILLGYRMLAEKMTAQEIAGALLAQNGPWPDVS